MRGVVRARWFIVGIAIVAAAAFALSVQAGRWWAVAGFEIGPFGSYRCFGGECKAAGLGWIGGSERWMRTGTSTLISLLSRSARETVECETPAARAISSIDTSCRRKEFTFLC